MKKGHGHKTNTFRVESQIGKMKRFLQEILRGDLFAQVCKQVKERPGRRAPKLQCKAGGKKKSLGSTGQHPGSQAFSASTGTAGPPCQRIRKKKSKQKAIKRQSTPPQAHCKF